MTGKTKRDKGSIAWMIWAGFILISSMCHLPDKMYPDILLSARGSDRGTAYIESRKIALYGNHAFMTWLEQDDDGNQEAVLSHYVNGYPKEQVYLGKTPDNHGGGSIALDSRGKVAVIYGGHLDVLKMRISGKPYALEDMSKEITITGARGGCLTYPSFVIDSSNCLHLICRETLLANNSPYKPGILYIRYDLNQDRIMDKKTLFLSEASKYGNFTASISERNGTLHVTYRVYLTDTNDRATQNGKVGYLYSEDGGDTFKDYRGKQKSLPLDEHDENLITLKGASIYISNHVVLSDGEVIVCCQRGESAKMLRFKDQTMMEERIKTEDFMWYDEYRMNPYISLAKNSKDQIYVAFSIVPKTAGGWTGKENILRLYGYSKGILEEIHQISEKNAWLCNIEAEPAGKRPRIIWTVDESEHTKIYVTR